MIPTALAPYLLALVSIVYAIITITVPGLVVSEADARRRIFFLHVVAQLHAIVTVHHIMYGSLYVPLETIRFYQDILGSIVDQMTLIMFTQTLMVIRFYIQNRARPSEERMREIRAFLQNTVLNVILPPTLFTLYRGVSSTPVMVFSLVLFLWILSSFDWELPEDLVDPNAGSPFPKAW
jgi:hypothetical protein